VNLSDSRTAGQPAATPLARLSAAEAVFNAIRQDIESGRLAVGSKLSSEATLSQQYGVSRSVIREALRSCTALGLTVTKTGKGTFVVANKVANDLTLGQYSARDLTEARPHIEVPAAGLAAERRSDEQADEIQRLASVAGEQQAADFGFFAAVVEAAGNVVFSLILNSVRAVYFEHAALFTPLVTEELRPLYERAADAIGRRDGAAAADAMRRHLEFAPAADRGRTP
jgi:DNA-binding FadR family transcriptional regulator